MDTEKNKLLKQLESATEVIKFYGEEFNWCLMDSDLAVMIDTVDYEKVGMPDGAVIKYGGKRARDWLKKNGG